MDFEHSENITPPESPVFGYSGDRDEESVISDSNAIYCLNCKGIPKRNDNSFNPDSLILRREVVCALESIKTPLNGSSCQDGGELRLVKCFNGSLFNPKDKEQLKIMVNICRKTVASLEILSDTSNTFHLHEPTANSGSEDLEELFNQHPWILRRSVCQFLNLIRRQLKYYRNAWLAADFEGLFLGLKKSLGSVKDWTPVLKGHCGYNGGNECTSAAYHFFHLQLELRWSLLLIFGVKESMIQWILDDLIHLAWWNYSNEGGTALNAKQAHNCTCVKEIWVMAALLVDDLQWEQKSFWSLYSEAMQRFQNSTSTDVYFPIWLTASLAQIKGYKVDGMFTPDQNPNSTYCKEGYKFVNAAFKNWANHGGKSIEIQKLSFEFSKHWGGDCDMTVSLWMQWTPRLDKGNDVSNFQSYSSVSQWLNLISRMSGSEDNAEQKTNRSIEDNYYMGSNNDPFLLFVRLVGSYAKSCSDKDFRKLKSNFFIKLDRIPTNDFGELGIIRVSTLFLVLISNVANPKEAISLAERFQDILNFGKSRNTPARRKAILRAYSCILILLIQKKLDIRSLSNITSSYMKIVDELLCVSSSKSASTSPGEPSKNDLIMIYIDLLENLPKFTPPLSNDLNLDRPSLISANFLMWLAKCGPNYVVRTARVLSQITDWIVTWITNENNLMYGFSSVSLANSEAKEFLVKIKEKCFPYMQTCVMQNDNRIPATDMEPIANLAGDVTLLTLKMMEGNAKVKAKDELFDVFAVDDRTSPIVSEYYIERLFNYRDLVENSFVLVKWAQVWIRLIALDCRVPEDLTKLILDTTFASTSNSELLTKFCCKKWSKDDIQQTVGQLTGLLNQVMNGTFLRDDQQMQRGENVITSVITTCVILLKSIRFDLLYIRNFPNSIGHRFLNALVPPSWPGTPPWERWSPTVLNCIEVNLFSIFTVIIDQAGFAQDNFLSRKLQDIVVLAFFGFIRNKENVDKDEHPLFTILNHCEDHGITRVQKEILPNVIAGDEVIKDAKLYPLFLRSVDMIRVLKFPTLVLRVVTGVIRTYVCNVSMDEANRNRCLNAFVTCFAFGSNHLFRDLAVNAFNDAMAKEFAFKSKRFFALCKSVVKTNHSVASEKVKKFLTLEVIPLITRHIELAEEKRGTGYDNSLRTDLKLLQAAVDGMG